MTDAVREIERKLKLARDLSQAAVAVRYIVAEAAEAYANGGPGVGEAIVVDRFKPAGNGRFPPLSKNYQEWKFGVSKEMNKQQKIKYGKAGRLITIKIGTRVEPGAGGTYRPKDIVKKSQPILVLTGELRARVASRRHIVEQVGDTAWVVFKDLPEYALYHHDPKTAPFPKRSPVEPDANDWKRVEEFIKRRISAITASFGRGTPVAFGGGQARIIT